MTFIDRGDAGRRLASRLAQLRGQVVVAGLARGGVPVAFEVARALDAPLDVIVVRKLGVPYEPELAVGAIGENGVRVINDDVMRLSGINAAQLDAVEARERVELERRSTAFRGARARLDLRGRTVVVVDDGVATGSSARAACQVVRAQGAGRVILAVPVAPKDWLTRMGDAADEYVCLETPEAFFSIGQFYENFEQSTDQEVIALLERSMRRSSTNTSASNDSDGFVERDEEIEIDAAGVRLAGQLHTTRGANALVVFAHGSGSSRLSPRNRYVASVLNAGGLSTLLFDLLTVAEARDRSNVFDISLLAQRLVDVTQWLRTDTNLARLRVGYFGASTGAAAALLAAARLGAEVGAVVSRGGRPDLAGENLGDVTAPTLLIVGGDDPTVLELNREAQARLHCENTLIVVPRATHLFEEPGTLQIAAETARDWFVVHLATMHAP